MPEVSLSRGRGRGRELITAGAASLAAGAIPDPRREALGLLAASLGIGVAEVLLDPDYPIPPAAAAAFEGMIERRRAGEPRAYVVGEAGFRYLTLRCDRRALIPRPESELLVDIVLERVARGVAVDVGTGTGCLALSLAREGDFDQVLGIDSEPGAVDLARSNGARVRSPVRWLRGNLTAMLRSGSVDALVSNPPYLTESEYAALDPSVAAWEPRSALVSGPDGLAATRTLLGALGVLRSGGWVALEVDAGRAPRVASMAEAAGLGSVEIRPDLYGRNRYVVGQKEIS